MQDIKVNLRFKDEQGNIIKAYPVVAEANSFLKEGSIVLLVLGGAIWIMSKLLDGSVIFSFFQ